MAIKRRTRTDGSESFTVQWMVGGGRNIPGATTASETFSARARAEQFQADVERAGWQWPEGWVKGRGYVAEQAVEAGMPTVADVAASYWAKQFKRVKLGHLKLKTLTTDQAVFNNHIEPTFGDVPFAGVHVDQIVDWLVMQIDLEAAPKSIKNRHGLLSPIMRHGQLVMKLRPDNPCELSKEELPRIRSRRDFMFFLEWEWAIVRKCLRLDARLICDTLLASAIRWGEVCALQVGDIEANPPDEHGEASITLNVRRAWCKRAKTDERPIDWAAGENKSWYLDTPKSKKPRGVVVSGQVARDLTAHAEGRDPGEHLFLTREGNPWRYPDFLSDRWQPAVHFAKQSGLVKHATIHMLRHTCVVWSIARGVDIYTVSHNLGHSSIQTTIDVYGGRLNLKDPKMAQAMAKAMLDVRQVITPAITDDEVAARRIRPGRRGERRDRIG